MNLNLGAIDAEHFKRIFLPMPNSVSRQAASEQSIVADQIFSQCLNSCGKARLQTSYEKSAVFSSQEHLDLQIDLLESCEGFLNSLLDVPKKNSYPWWLKIVSRPTLLIQTQELKDFAAKLAESKYPEAYSCHSKKAQAKSSLELCAFLEEAHRRNCWVLCQVENPSMN